MSIQHLCPFVEFGERLPGLTERTLLRLSKNGAAPPFVRASPKSKAYWNRAQITAWIDAKLRPLIEGAPS